MASTTPRRRLSMPRRVAPILLAAVAPMVALRVIGRRAQRGRDTPGPPHVLPAGAVVPRIPIDPPDPERAESAIRASTAQLAKGPAQPVDAAAPVASPTHATTAGHAPRLAIPDHGGRRAVQATWLIVYAAALGIPLALVLVPDEAAPRSFMLELGSALGIAALSLLAVQLVLPARLPGLAAIGAEVAVRLHRRTADVMLAVVAAHVAAVMIADPTRLELLRFFGEPWRAQAAIGSVAALVVLFVTSIARRRIRLSYAGWRGLHVVAGAVALVLAVVHTVGVGRYLDHGPAGVALVGLTVAGLGALVVMRSTRFRRGGVRPYFVEQVVAEQGGAVTLVLGADGHPGQRFIPGQFAWLRLDGARTLLAEHPFSYSSNAMDPAHPTFTMQPRSGFSARAAAFEVGTRLQVDGPHGAFRPRARTAGTVLVAGGIGITPSMSILRTAAGRRDPRPYVLFYGARNLSALPFLEEIEALQGRLHLEVVIVLSAPAPDWPGERGRINGGVLDRHLPKDLRRWQYMVCGAAPFVDGVIEAFEALGVPGERVHAERFVEV